MNKTLFDRLSRHVSRPLSALGCAAVLSMTAIGPAMSATVEGCNPVVAEAQKKVAELKVAKAVADAEEIITQPESANALICFNQLAGKSAQAGGAMFSGDFTAELGPIVTTALNSYYDDFANSLGFQNFANQLGIDVGGMLNGVVQSGLNNVFTELGFDPNQFASVIPLFTGEQSIQGLLGSVVNGINYDTALSTSSECNGIKGLWDMVQGKGINKSVPQLSLKDMMQGPGALANIPGIQNTKFYKNWQANTDNGVIQAAASTVEALPQATQTGNFSNVTSSCAVFQQAGILPPDVPCPQ